MFGVHLISLVLQKKKDSGAMRQRACLFLLLCILAWTSAEPEMDTEEEEEAFENAIETTMMLNITTTPTTVPTTTKDYCHCDLEIYGTDILEGVLKSPNFPGAHCDSGKCMYKILPHPNMTVRLNVETAAFSSGTKLKIWNILDVDGQEYNVYQSDYVSTLNNDYKDYKEFTTAVNVGFKIIFEMSRNTYSYSGFKIKFARMSNGCTFYLTPSVEGKKHHLEEMYIEIETENRIRVQVKSYDDEGMFVRETPLDINRGLLVDASKVEVSFFAFSSDSDGYKTPKITAKLMNRSCICPETVMNITSSTSSVTVRSPGFPDLYCPSKSCHTFIRSEKIEKKPEDKVPLLLITTNCTLNENDYLRLADCVCSLYDDKEYKNSGWLSVPIPPHCEFIHCHWKFSAYSSYSYPQKYVSIVFKMDNPSSSDVVFVITEKITEEYDAELLKHKQSITSAASPIEFTFSRFGSKYNNSDATLNVTWFMVEGCTCSDEKIFVTVDDPKVITSPNYPDMYCPNLICRHTFYAPKGHFLEIRIDKADIERYHDFLKIYDGNSSSDPLITRVSGLVKNEVHNSTRDTVFFLFMSDESTSRMGYHANVIAHRIPVTPVPEKSHLVILVAIIAVIIAMVSLAVFFVTRRKSENYRQLQSLNNPTVSYTASETGSPVKISYGPGNTGRAHEVETELI
ncbi:hypothetical protein GCK72_023759 [Caenorhabditis remanei]|uniref:CUB domain-containing protein n=1 Tax=Caenorhabditis remanei TaxID=31234 RepID=A0A6A5FXP5_CAERE|nr:hypothetical protein GCK72_023759 [Caenorhabditis remanei]KAF1747297.1 hypothetical protein GCK72_023759 [Caenorhabditis remanei]